MTEPQSARPAILVLGMHRSGTSAVAGLLGDLGFGLPRDGIAASPENPRGHHEPQALVRVDDRVLRTARTSWFDPRPLDLAAIPPDVAAAHRADMAAALAESFGDAAAIVVKDPRLCRLLPIILPVLAARSHAPNAVLVLRHPAAIARSLHARDGMQPATAHALWLRHMIDAERDSRALPRVVLDYDALVDDPTAAAARLAGFLGLPVPGSAARAIEPALRRNRPDARAALEPRVAGLMDEAWSAFRALAQRDDASARTRIDAVAAAWDDDRRLLDDLIHDELRHRRHEALQTRAPRPEPETPPMPAPPAIDPMPAPAASPEPAAPLADQVRAIRDSGLFDTAWYLDRYPDAAASGLDPIEHYLTVGAPAGHDPNPLFRTAYYARQQARRDAVAHAAGER